MQRVIILILCYLTSYSISSASNSSKVTIKIGIYYTNAAGALSIEDAKERIAVVQTILDEIEENTYEAVLTSFTQIDYKEPKHRRDGLDGDYGIELYDGMRQVFRELLEHVTIYSYFHDLGQSGSLGMLEESEVDQNYALLDLMVRSDINLFIVEEEGLEDYYFVQNPLDSHDDALGQYKGGDYDGLLPAVIHTTEYQGNVNSVALAVFGLLADPLWAIEIDEESTSGSLLSFFSYYYDSDNISFTLKNALSSDNECVFKKSLAKMQMDSKDVIEINGNIANSNKRVKIDARQHVHIVNSSEYKSVALVPKGANDFIAISTNAYTADFTESVTCKLVARNSEVFNNEENYIENPVSEDPETLPSSLTIYPNPFTNQFNIRFEGEGEEVATLYVFDMQGRKVATQRYDLEAGLEHQEVQFDASDLNRGMYIYRLQLGEKLHSGTIVKDYRR